MPQTQKCYSIEKKVEWKITWTEIDFDDLAKNDKSVAGFSPCRQFSVGPNDVP